MNIMSSVLQTLVNYWFSLSPVTQYLRQCNFYTWIQRGVFITIIFLFILKHSCTSFYPLPDVIGDTDFQL